MNTVIYFIEDPATGLIKVGYTGNFQQRLKALTREVGHDLRVLATNPGDRVDEQFFHGLLKRHRDHGEWFRPHAMLTHVIDFARKLDARFGSAIEPVIGDGFWQGWEGF